MKIKHQELEIPIENPFNHCKLGREAYARILTDIINIYVDGFVLGINNEWGTGKTTFVKMWQQQLKNEGFQTIYFNAWENDFDNNPLVALMSELETLINAKNKKVFKSVLKKGAVLIKNIAPALAKSLIKKYVVDVNEITVEAIENITKASTEILEEEIKEFSSKKKTIDEFRKELEKFIEQTGSTNPLVFIIDELDRCRPNYAVEILEQIKHFFSVTGIVFVLSIDKKHLASAVRGFYGSELINTDEYLRRFIDLEYSIPQPSEKIFSEYLFDYYSFNEFFSSTERQQYKEFQSDAQLLLKVAELLFKKSNANLRQQEKIFGQTRLILKAFYPNQYIFSHLLFILIYLKTMQSEVYLKIERNTFSIPELSKVFEDIIPSDSENLYDLNVIYVEALLLHFYNNNQKHQKRMKLFEADEHNNVVSPIRSKFEDKKTTLGGCFRHISQQWNYDDMSLKYLLDKINLVDPIII